MTKKSIKIEAVGSRIEIIGGSIYPKEEGWSFPCPCCEKWLRAKLHWDQGATEFQLTILPDAKHGQKVKP